MADIKIPALGESVAGGQISKWHFKVGDAVKVGDVLLTLETDKVAAEVTADTSGVLTSIANQEGDDVVIGAVVGVIAEGAAAPAASAPVPAAPAPVAEAKSAPEPEATAVPAPAPKPAPAPAAAPAAASDCGCN